MGIIKDFTAYLNPSMWIRNKRTDLVWDEALNRLMDEFPLVKRGVFTHTLGENVIWTSNYPYAYGSLYTLTDKTDDALPKRSTVLRLKKAADKLESKFNILDYVKFKGY